jgi:plastocyanin
MRAVPAACLAAATIALAACGGGDEREGAGAPETRPATAPAEAERPPARTPPAEVVAVRETEFELDPATARVEQAGVVRIEARNEGEQLHALTVVAPAGEESTPEIQPGDTAALNVELPEPGEYVWYCPVGDHRDRGMEGTIVVAGGSRRAPAEPEAGDGGDRSRDGSRGRHADARGERERARRQGDGDDGGAGGGDPVTPEEKRRLRERIREQQEEDAPPSR